MGKNANLRRLKKVLHIFINNGNIQKEMIIIIIYKSRRGVHMFRNKKLLSIMLCIMALMLFVAGCGSKETTTTGKEKEAPSSQEERVVKHAGGETTIKGTPKRIVTLYQGA